MFYLLLGTALLLLFFLAGRWFVSAQPAQVISALRIAALVASGGLGLFFVLTGRFNWAVPAFAAFVAVAARMGGLWRPVSRESSRDASSSVETEYLRMRLDHESGEMDGLVLRGAFEGRTLSTLSIEALLRLLDECRFQDLPSVRVLEAYLDRTQPTWRERAEAEEAEAQGQAGADGSAGGGGGRGPGGRSRMSRREALEILGLEADASPEQIKEAHRRLMSKNHPDRGGSTYLAAKINAAKEALLG